MEREHKKCADGGVGERVEAEMKDRREWTGKKGEGVGGGGGGGRWERGGMDGRRGGREREREQREGVRENKINLYVVSENERKTLDDVCLSRTEVFSPLNVTI